MLDKSASPPLWKWAAAGSAVFLWGVAVNVFGPDRRPEKEEAFPIAGTLYEWPDDTIVIAPEPGVYGNGYIRYNPNPSSLTKDSVQLIYDGEYQEPFNEAGLPHLNGITSRSDKPYQHFKVETPAGTIVCSRTAIDYESLFPCGLSFVHRGARWQLRFGDHRLQEAEQLHQAAVVKLETFRRSAKHSN